MTTRKKPSGKPVMTDRMRIKGALREMEKYACGYWPCETGVPSHEAIDGCIDILRKWMEKTR